MKGLKPKNKGHTNFFGCCDLMERVYLMRTFKIAPRLILQTASPYTQKHPKNIFVLLKKTAFLLILGRSKGNFLVKSKCPTAPLGLVKIGNFQKNAIKQKKLEAPLRFQN